MLKTLITIGNQLAKNMDEWDDLINYIEVDKTSGKDNAKLNNSIAEIVFDLDEMDVYVSKELRAYDDRSPKTWRCIRIFERRGKSVVSCVYVKKNLNQFRKAFFGSNPKIKKGEFVQKIESKQPGLISSQLYQALEQIYHLKPVFDEKFIDDKKESVSQDKLFEGLKLGKWDRVILLYASVKSEKLGFTNPAPIKDLDGFDQFFIPSKTVEDEKESKEPKICYATGKSQPDVIAPQFPRGVSINNMFVVTTKNYASHLDSNEFYANYQASDSVQTALERGSSYVLKNLSTRIAGINHCIIPEFFIL